MAKRVTREELKSLIQDALDMGLSTQEMADKFNSLYGSEDSKLTAADMTRFKEMVGLKGAKPKKKRNSVFELIDDMEMDEPEEVLPFEDSEPVLENEPEEVVDQF